MSRDNFSLDLTDMDKRLLALSIAGRKAAQKGLWEGAALLKKLADEVEPKTPHLHGNLRGDARRGPTAKSGKAIRKDWWPQITPEDRGSNVIGVIVAYCAPYASRWHEATDVSVKWSEPGVGPKFLEAKMARAEYRDMIFKLVADVIKEELHRA